MITGRRLMSPTRFSATMQKLSESIHISAATRTVRVSNGIPQGYLLWPSRRKMLPFPPNLAKITNPSKYGNLFTKSINNYNDFLGHMDTMYSYISPGPFGETSTSSFSSAIEKYASDKKVTLSAVISNASFTLDNTADYVKAGLKIDSPVATLNLSKF